MLVPESVTLVKFGKVTESRTAASADVRTGRATHIRLISLECLRQGVIIPLVSSEALFLFLTIEFLQLRSI